MAGTQHFSPGDIQFQLVYDRVDVLRPVTLKLTEELSLQTLWATNVFKSGDLISGIQFVLIDAVSPCLSKYSGSYGAKNLLNCIAVKKLQLNSNYGVIFLISLTVFKMR